MIHTERMPGGRTWYRWECFHCDYVSNWQPTKYEAEKRGSWHRETIHE